MHKGAEIIYESKYNKNTNLMEMILQLLEVYYIRNFHNFIVLIHFQMFCQIGAVSDLRPLDSV